MIFGIIFVPVTSEHFHIPSPLEQVELKNLADKNIRFYVKRDDLIHPDISGNKWRKLNLNIEQALVKRRKTLLTFGGPFSNHIAATAKAAQVFGLSSIGIIRGLDADLQNPTLSFAKSCGMEIKPISREEFRKIDTWDYIDELKLEFGEFFRIPSGGANFYGVQGCISIINEIRQEIEPSRIFLGCGTATTASGIAIGNRNECTIHAVSALKGGTFLEEVIRKNLEQTYSDDETVDFQMSKIDLMMDYHFGGFAKVSDELIRFMRDFYTSTNIKLDPIYSSKAAYAMVEFANRKKDNNPENWVLIHTGGLQGLSGMEEKLGFEIY